MRLAPRTDSNQTEIVEALRRCGASVLSLAAIGKGCPDLLISIPGGHTFLAEIKDGSKPHSKRQLTPAQKLFHEKWVGAIVVIHSVEEALTIVKQIRRN